MVVATEDDFCRKLDFIFTLSILLPSLLLPPQPFFLENYFSFSFVTIEKMCKGAFQCSVAYKS